MGWGEWDVEINVREKRVRVIKYLAVHLFMYCPFFTHRYAPIVAIVIAEYETRISANEFDNCAWRNVNVACIDDDDDNDNDNDDER